MGAVRIVGAVVLLPWQIVKGGARVLVVVGQALVGMGTNVKGAAELYRKPGMGYDKDKAAVEKLIKSPALYVTIGTGVILTAALAMNLAPAVWGTALALLWTAGKTKTIVRKAKAFKRGLIVGDTFAREQLGAAVVVALGVVTGSVLAAVGAAIVGILAVNAKVITHKLLTGESGAREIVGGLFVMITGISLGISSPALGLGIGTYLFVATYGGVVVPGCKIFYKDVEKGLSVLVKGRALRVLIGGMTTLSIVLMPWDSAFDAWLTAGVLSVISYAIGKGVVWVRSYNGGFLKGLWTLTMGWGKKAVSLVKGRALRVLIGGMTTLPIVLMTWDSAFDAWFTAGVLSVISYAIGKGVVWVRSYNGGFLKGLWTLTMGWGKKAVSLVKGRALRVLIGGMTTLSIVLMPWDSAFDAWFTAGVLSVISYAIGKGVVWVRSYNGGFLKALWTLTMDWGKKAVSFVTGLPEMMKGWA